VPVQLVGQDATSKMNGRSTPKMNSQFPAFSPVFNDFEIFAQTQIQKRIRCSVATLNDHSMNAAADSSASTRR
jgi:hypothetical protein